MLRCSKGFNGQQQPPHNYRQNRTDWNRTATTGGLLLGREGGSDKPRCARLRAVVRTAFLFSGLWVAVGLRKGKENNKRIGMELWLGYCYLSWRRGRERRKREELKEKGRYFLFFIGKLTHIRGTSGRRWRLGRWGESRGRATTGSTVGAAYPAKVLGNSDRKPPITASGSTRSLLSTKLKGRRIAIIYLR